MDPRPEAHDDAAGALVHGFHDPAALPRQVEASRRAADAARRVVAGLVATRVDAEVLDRVTASLTEAAGLLEPHRPSSRYSQTPGLHGGAGADPHVWESHPFIGPSHPLAPPFEIRRVGDRAVGTVTFRTAHEGPPGAAHGGFVAAMFDMVLGAATAVVAMPGLTGTLTVRYRRPTPLDREVRYEGWLERAEARKVLVAGVSTCDGEVLAEGEAVFVRVAPHRYDPPDDPPGDSPGGPPGDSADGSHRAVV